jgi:hypothetical protein
LSIIKVAERAVKDADVVFHCSTEAIRKTVLMLQKKYEHAIDVSELIVELDKC